MKSIIDFQVGERLDKVLAKAFSDFSRAYLARLIDSGEVLVNGKPQKSGYRLKEDDEIKIMVGLEEEQVIEDIDLPILYEDDDVLVINKPSGVISHSRGKYWYEPSVASFLRQKTGEGEVNDRAGIVHRLDRATSGLMICAKNEAALSFLQKEFQNRNVEKTYLALIEGELPEKKGLIDVPIGRNPKKPSTFRADPNGKPAQTDFKTIESNDKYSLIELKPKTGRTHQLRVHLAFLKHPIIGDELYSGKPAKRLMLHAQSLKIKLPNNTVKEFKSPLPPEFKELKK